jgi:hypothetical protein
MNAEDLRNLADALDRMTKATRETGVRIAGYQQQFIAVDDHQMCIDWVNEAKNDDPNAGHYTVTIPEFTY